MSDAEGIPEQPSSGGGANRPDPRREASEGGPRRAADMISDHAPSRSGEGDDKFGDEAGAELAGGKPDGAASTAGKAADIAQAGKAAAGAVDAGKAAAAGAADPTGGAGNLRNYIPQGDTFAEKKANLGGIAARQALNASGAGAAAVKAADAIAAADAATGGHLRNRLNKRLPGRLQPALDGFLGNKDKQTPSVKKGAQNPTGEQEGEGSGGFKIPIVVSFIGAPIVVLAVILTLLLVVAAVVTGQQVQVQPERKSDVTVANYVPTGWDEVFKSAAKSTENADPYAVVPWTVLAGIAKVQTDLGRYSPYDDMDRDPGRTAEPIGTDEGAIGDDDPDPETDDPGQDSDDPDPDDGGTGDEPGGKGGEDGDSTSVAKGHPGPPAGTLKQQIKWYLEALKGHESGGDYKARNRYSGACGAYQYLTSSWEKHGGYATACDAPASVQDRKARKDSLAAWKSKRLDHKWQKVAANHLLPKWAPYPSKWNRRPSKHNPTVWEYVDDVMKRMRQAAAKDPDKPSPSPTKSPTTSSPPMKPVAYVQPTPEPAANQPADGCPVAAPKPPIGGKSGQGVGPFLLKPAAAAEMRDAGHDPQDPCASARYVAQALSKAAEKVYADPESPKWIPNGTNKDKRAAREYWSKVIALSGIFTERSAEPDKPCALPPADPGNEQSVGFKVIYIWACEIRRVTELNVVTGAAKQGDKVTFTVASDRSAAEKLLVDEALSVSYAASKWKVKGCDKNADSAQGIFPMTKKEAMAAEVTDRCDVAANISGAAKLVLAIEKTPPAKRETKLGPYQPMVGGWQSLGIALGADLKLFAQNGPGGSFAGSDACTKVMDAFLTALAPVATEFAKLKEPPPAAKLPAWRQKFAALLSAHSLTEPAADPACATTPTTPGYYGELAEVVAGRIGTGPHAANLSGLGNYFDAEDDATEPSAEPVPGKDSLVVPRLAARPLKAVAAPIEPDATDAWDQVGTKGSTALGKQAVDYAWFFGGVIAPFDTAGKRIGAVLDKPDRTNPDDGGGGTDDGTGDQGGDDSGDNGGDDGGDDSGDDGSGGDPDGCPTKPNKSAIRGKTTMRNGSSKIGVEKLCTDSVAKARTPEAAQAIKWALNHIGMTYSRPRRNLPKYADCSSFVSKAYRSAVPGLYSGNAPRTSTLRAVEWMKKIALSKVKPGDLVEPHGGHVAMQLAHGYKVHTNATGDVAHVARDYSRAYWAGYFVPSKAK